MNRRNLFVLVLSALTCVPAVVSAPLMYRAQTVIDVPSPSQDVALSRLSYKANAFEAKLVSVRLEPKGADDADPYAATWTFLGSNNDGQMHKIEIWVRLLDSSGKQIAMFSGKSVLAPGSRDQACVVEMKIKPETWKAVKSVRIVADFLS
jgi:hypothetical protein